MEMMEVERSEEIERFPRIPFDFQGPSSGFAGDPSDLSLDDVQRRSDGLL